MFNDILKTILSFASSGILGFVLVIVIVVFAAINGIFRKTFAQLWQMILFGIIFAVSYFVLMPLLGNWICDKAMLQFGLNTTVVVDSVEVYQINTFADLIDFLCKLTENAKYTSEYSYNLAHSITYAMALAILVLADIIVSPILTAITWPLLRLAIPKKWDHSNKRFVGPLLSIIEVVFAFSIIMNCLSAYSEGMQWILKDPLVLQKMDIDTKVLTVLQFFTVDFFGYAKYVNLPLFNFQFAANGAVYNTAEEFASLASTVFPKDGNAEVLAETYKARLLALWMAEHGVSLPPKDVLKLAIRNAVGR